jgi:hypothetical protein
MFNFRERRPVGTGGGGGYVVTCADVEESSGGFRGGEGPAPFPFSPEIYNLIISQTQDFRPKIPSFFFINIDFFITQNLFYNNCKKPN